MESKQFPARLHVLLAREAPVGVVIRRGPAKHVCTIGWRRTNDTFTIGQWLKGRIYERRSDLSPDGRHMIYFAMNGRWKSKTKGSWTAISRIPYLKAIGLWAKGDCWHGGGLFMSKGSYWVNDGYGHTLLQQPSQMEKLRSIDGANCYGGECLGVYYLRLQRDGWKLVQRDKEKEHRIDVFEKGLRGGWVLRKLAHATTDHPVGAGCYFDEHELEHRKAGQVIRCPNWEWADVDRNRLVWAEGGKLHAGRLTDAGLGNVSELHDFNDMTFEPIEAPY